MGIAPQGGVVKQGFSELMDVLMAQGAAFAESKFLSLIKRRWEFSSSLGSPLIISDRAPKISSYGCR